MERATGAFAVAFDDSDSLMTHAANENYAKKIHVSLIPGSPSSYVRAGGAATIPPSGKRIR